MKAGANVDAKDVNSYTALHESADDGHLDVVQTLLKTGANVDAKSLGCVTALSWAKNNNHAEVAAILQRACRIRIRGSRPESVLVELGRKPQRHLCMSRGD
jgi:ankyrin repeat protein